MLRRSLQPNALPHLLLAAAIGVGCGAASVGCNSPADSDSDSVGYLGYIFTERFDDERRWLNLPTTPDSITACYYQELPPVEDADWRVTELDPELQRAAAELIEDQAALEHYEADTAASKKQNRRVCLERPGQSDFCYFPDIAVSRIDAFLWKFWLGPEVTLSRQSLELIEALRAAHEECWTKGTPAPDYGGDS